MIIQINTDFEQKIRDNVEPQKPTVEDDNDQDKQE